MIPTPGQNWRHSMSGETRHVVQVDTSHVQGSEPEWSVCWVRRGDSVFFWCGQHVWSAWACDAILEQ